MDMQERSQQQLRDKLSEAQENENILTIELEETRRELEELREELELARYKLGSAPVQTEALPAPQTATSAQAPASASDYLSQLRIAQERLVEHNSSIHRLLEHIEVVGESERKRPGTAKK